MQKIKFRGISKDIGNFVYGDLVTYYKDSFVIAFKNDEGDVVHAPVESESVAQFCGYDKNGDEVYEGDETIYSDGTVYTAEIDRWERILEDAVLKKE